jgi:uncharacterized protein with LGFP repeats
VKILELFGSSGGFPVAAAETRNDVTTQRFEAGVVYSSDATGVHRIAGRKLAFYEQLGGPGAWLGFPKSNARRVVTGGGGWVQDFEHGRIFHREGYEPIAVPVDAPGSVNLVEPPLGWPISAEKPVGDSFGERIQFFENGVVTLRDGRREVWVRPVHEVWVAPVAPSDDRR